MVSYNDSLKVLDDLFGKDCTFTLATVQNNIPSQRVVDTYYHDGIFWVVTYGQSNKVKDIKVNPDVSICNTFHTFKGKAYYAGHPLLEENKDIREKLIKVFEPWYFAHNNEKDEEMCYVKIVPEAGFFHKDATGYIIDFNEKTVKDIPFSPDIEMID